eukprot:gene19598-26281_t
MKRKAERNVRHLLGRTIDDGAKLIQTDTQHVQVLCDVLSSMIADVKCSPSSVNDYLATKCIKGPDGREVVLRCDTDHRVCVRPELSLENLKKDICGAAKETVVKLTQCEDEEEELIVLDKFKHACAALLATIPYPPRLVNSVLKKPAIKTKDGRKYRVDVKSFGGKPVVTVVPTIEDIQLSFSSLMLHTADIDFGKLNLFA